MNIALHLNLASRLLARNSENSSLTLWHEPDGTWSCRGERDISESEGISFSAWGCPTPAEAIIKMAHEVMKADGELPMMEDKRASHIWYGKINVDAIQGRDVYSISVPPDALDAMPLGIDGKFHVMEACIKPNLAEISTTAFKNALENVSPVHDTLFALNLAEDDLSWDSIDAPALDVGTAVIVLDVREKHRGVYRVKEILRRSHDRAHDTYIIASPFGKELSVLRNVMLPITSALYQFPRLDVGTQVIFPIDGRLMQYAGKTGRIIASTWHGGLMSIQYDVALGGERIPCAAWEVIDAKRIVGPTSHGRTDDLQGPLRPVEITRPMCLSPADKVVLGEQFGPDAGRDAVVTDILDLGNRRIKIEFTLAYGHRRYGLGRATDQRDPVIIR